MKTAGYVWMACALTFLLLWLAKVSQGQSPAASASASPSNVEPASSVDPKDPPADVSPDSAPADVPEAASNTELQAQVQNALGKVPELSNDSLRVAALSDGLEITGSVVTGRERVAAIRIAESYARGRKVVDHIVVNGRNPAPSEAPRTAHQANAQ